MSSGDDAPDAVDVEDGVAMPPPTAAPAQLRAAAKARLLAASLGTANAAPERERIAGRYRLIREIGRGGIGSVWEAELAPIGKRTAIKLLRSRTSAHAEEHEARLLREAQAASAIGHEHIVRVDDFGIDPHAGPFLVMELLQGRSLAAEIVAHAPMSWPRVAGMLLQLCSALAAAHRAGIVHRDLKPANVFLVRREGGADHCKLLDFGLCKPQPDDAASPVLTAMGTRLGTPGYMAPEQIRGEEVDGRADLYALGCIAYEMLAGRPPFGARRAAELVAAHLEDTPPQLRELVPELPALAIAVVERAMAKDRARRFMDADALARAIRAGGFDERATDHTVPPAGEPVVVAREPSFARTRWRGAAALAIAVAGAGAMMVTHAERSASGEQATPADAQPSQVARPTLRVEPQPPPVVPTRVPVVTNEPTPVASASPKAAAPMRRPTRRPAAAPVVEVAAVPESPPPPPAVPAPSKPLVDGIRDPFGTHEH